MSLADRILGLVGLERAALLGITPADTAEPAPAPQPDTLADDAARAAYTAWSLAPDRFARARARQEYGSAIEKGLELLEK